MTQWMRSAQNLRFSPRLCWLSGKTRKLKTMEQSKRWQLRGTYEKRQKYIGQSENSVQYWQNRLETKPEDLSSEGLKWAIFTKHRESQSWPSEGRCALEKKLRWECEGEETSLYDVCGWRFGHTFLVCIYETKWGGRWDGQDLGKYGDSSALMSDLLNRARTSSTSDERGQCRCKPFSGTFERHVATKLTRIKTKTDPKYYGTIRKKWFMCNNRTSALFLLGSVTPFAENKPRERQRSSHRVNQRQIHGRGNGEGSGFQRYIQTDALKHNTAFSHRRQLALSVLYKKGELKLVDPNSI